MAFSTMVEGFGPFQHQVKILRLRLLQPAALLREPSDLGAFEHPFVARYLRRDASLLLAKVSKGFHDVIFADHPGNGM